jgi:hypothetical protein
MSTFRQIENLSYFVSVAGCHAHEKRGHVVDFPMISHAHDKRGHGTASTD